MQGQDVTQPQQSTQLRHPWRATLRTVAAGIVALAPVTGEIMAGAHLNTTAVGGQIIGYAAATTRILAIPAVDNWLREYLPWLATSPGHRQ